MTDERASQPSSSGEPVAPSPPTSDRRGFLRQLTGQAVNAAGTIAGASQVLLRSASAAGDAMAAELGIGGRDPEEAGSVDPPPATPLPAGLDAAAAPVAPGSPTPVSAPLAASAASTVSAAPAPTLLPLRPLTDRESELLASRTAIVAVNTLEGTPQLTRAPFHWDGQVARLSGHLFGARIGNIQRDGRISVMVEDARGWLTLIGEATIVAGPAALVEAQPLLAHLYPNEPAEDVWARLEAEATQAVVVLRPTRVVSDPR